MVVSVFKYQYIQEKMKVSQMLCYPYISLYNKFPYKVSIYKFTLNFSFIFKIFSNTDSVRSMPRTFYISQSPQNLSFNVFEERNFPLCFFKQIHSSPMYHSQMVALYLLTLNRLSLIKYRLIKYKYSYICLEYKAMQARYRKCCLFYYSI